MTRLESLGRRKWLALLILCSVALPVRLWVVGQINYYTVYNDGVVYLQVGVNLKDGLGYVGGVRRADGPYFFREPAYPAFIAAVFTGYEWFTGDEVGVPDDWRLRTYILNPRMRQVTQVIKKAQAVLDTGNVLLFFLTLSLVFRPSAAFALALCAVFLCLGNVFPGSWASGKLTPFACLSGKVAPST